jgi:hypothetical protein
MLDPAAHPPVRFRRSLSFVSAGSMQKATKHTGVHENRRHEVLHNSPPPGSINKKKHDTRNNQPNKPQLASQHYTHPPNPPKRLAALPCSLKPPLLLYKYALRTRTNVDPQQLCFFVILDLYY